MIHLNTIEQKEETILEEWKKGNTYLYFVHKPEISEMVRWIIRIKEIFNADFIHNKNEIRVLSDSYCLQYDTKKTQEGHRSERDGNLEWNYHYFNVYILSEEEAEPLLKEVIVLNLEGKQ